MKIKLQYIIIAILVVTNIYFILDGKTKSYGSDNSEFKREMNYLEKRIKFDENQLKLAKIEYERYSSNKEKIERKFRKYDLVISNYAFSELPKTLQIKLKLSFKKNA